MSHTLRRRALFLTSLIALAVLAACGGPAAKSQASVRIYSTSAASPWLESAYDCVSSTTALVRSEDPDSDIVLRLGEPANLTGPAYQIGTDELLVVTHPQVGIGPLSILQAQALFAGQYANWSAVGGADLPVEVWGFAPSTDIQEVFEGTVMQGRPLTSLARLAVSAQHMSDSVGTVPGSIGFLPRRWKAGNTHEALTFASVPVLALVRATPSGPLADLLACMQAHK